jgi:hypothetical protein
VAVASLDYSATDWYSAEELLILLINFMKNEVGTGSLA